MEFENEADRDYYVKDDPAHSSFKHSIEKTVKAQVIDYKPGVM